MTAFGDGCLGLCQKQSNHIGLIPASTNLFCPIKKSLMDSNIKNLN